LIGIPAATRTSEGNSIHPIWSVLGWSIFGGCASMLVAVLLFGQYATSAGIIEAKRFYIEQHTQRTFDERLLIEAFNDRKITTPIVIVGVRDPEITELAINITKALRKAMLHVIGYPAPDDDWFWQIDATRDVRGISVLTQDINNPSDNQAEIFVALTKAKLSPIYVKLTAKWIIQTFPGHTVIFIGYR
jgi:hypothetical protein